MPGAGTCQTGADLLLRHLQALGVRHVFGYPGGQLTPLYDALQREQAVRHILARHEQAAAFMADGYARASGQPGVCLAVCGPGVYNAATPLASAFTDSIPVLLISGQVPVAGLGLRTGYYHENEQLLACASMTKARFRAGRVAEIPGGVGSAWRCLTSGRPGPVLLEIPVDVLRAAAAVANELPASASVEPPPLPVADVAALAELLSRWQRPLLLAGGGVVSAGAGALLVQLAEFDLCRSFGLACLPQPDALANAVAGRDPAAGVIFHSDYAEDGVKPENLTMACSGGAC